MRSLSIIFAAGVITLSLPTWTGPARAEEGCTGENCQAPQGQGSGGHECERQKNEQTVS